MRPPRRTSRPIRWRKSRGCPTPDGPPTGQRPPGLLFRPPLEDLPPTQFLSPHSLTAMPRTRPIHVAIWILRSRLIVQHSSTFFHMHQSILGTRIAVSVIGRNL